MRSRNDAAHPVRQRVPDGGATVPHRLATKLPLRTHTHRQRRERQAAAGLGRAKLASGGLDDHAVPAQKQQARVVMAAPVLAQTKVMPGGRRRRQRRRGVLALLEANKDNDAAKANGNRNPNSSDLWLLTTTTSSHTRLSIVSCNYALTYQLRVRRLYTKPASNMGMCVLDVVGARQSSQLTSLCVFGWCHVPLRHACRTTTCMISSTCNKRGSGLGLPWRPGRCFRWLRLLCYCW